MLAPWHFMEHNLLWREAAGGWEWRLLGPREYEILQRLPTDYTAAADVGAFASARMAANAWHLEVA